jgi:NAD(P)-dependent dehydrogenase (short-subunit alcohol dehydrogenase family)
MYPDLHSKVIIITGAAGNLGAAVARYFESAGANLVLLDRSQEAFDRTFGAELPSNWLVRLTDITQQASIDEMIAATLAKFGQIHVLVNIAGGYAGGKTILETDEAIWEQQMTLNAKSVFLMSRAVARVLVEQGQGGRIISVGAKPGLQGTGQHSAYAASKSAVLRLTETLAVELRPYGINTNAVLPSVLDTPANRTAMPNANPELWVKPESLAEVIGFLAAQASRDVNGALLPVYGGS